MTLAVSLGVLRTEVRRQTDTENDPHVTDAEIDGWINKGIRVLIGQIQRTDPDFFLITSTLTTVAGTTEYDFADAGSFSPTMSDFRSIRGIDYQSGGQSFTLRSYRFEERNQRGPLVSGLRILPRYLVRSNGINGDDARLTFDIDPGGRTYSVHYIGAPGILVADADRFDSVMGWDDYVIAYASKRVHKKSDELELAADCENEMARVLSTVMVTAPDRHADGQERIARTRRRFRGGFHHHEEF